MIDQRKHTAIEFHAIGDEPVNRLFRRLNVEPDQLGPL